MSPRLLALILALLPSSSLATKITITPEYLPIPHDYRVAYHVTVDPEGLEYTSVWGIVQWLWCDAEGLASSQEPVAPGWIQHDLAMVNDIFISRNHIEFLNQSSLTPSSNVLHATALIQPQMPYPIEFHFSVSFNNTEGGSTGALVTLPWPVPVPEPNTAALVSLGLLALAARRMRRAKATTRRA